MARLLLLVGAWAQCEDASLLQRVPAMPQLPQVIPQRQVKDMKAWTTTSIFMRAFYKACSVMELRQSTTETFPQQMVLSNNFSALGIGLGSTSYAPTWSPDFYTATTYLPYDGSEFNFLINWQAELDLRIASFAVAATAVYGLTPTAVVHQAYSEIAKVADPGPAQTFSWTQGEGKNWESDDFAGQLVGHSLMACLLEASSEGYVLDLSAGGQSDTPVQVMKRKALGLAPENLLRAKGHFEVQGKGLRLVAVEVQDGEQWLKLVPTDGTRWTLAKVSLLSLALFVLECYHTGIHLFAGGITAAIKRSIPAGTPLGKAMTPSTLQTIFALFEQAAILHSDHNSAFSGLVWPCDIKEVWQVTRDMVLYYRSASPEEILGLPESKPDWWAGNSAAFIEPISELANLTASAGMEDTTALVSLQAKLVEFGLDDGGTPVTTVAGLSRLVRQMLFVAGICHSHMYATREAFTPLLGFTETKPFLSYLREPTIIGALGFGAVVSLIWPTVPSQLNELLILIYATSSGFGPGVPQLGDGPYPDGNDLQLMASVRAFQGRLNVTRRATYEMFGDIRDDAFVPGYLYPVNVTKPFGYAITQTAYI